MHIKAGVVHMASYGSLALFEFLDSTLIKGLCSWSVIHLSPVMTLVVVEVIISCHVRTYGDQVHGCRQLCWWEDKVSSNCCVGT